MEVRRFLANQIKLNKTRLHVIRCDDSADSLDPPQFEMNDEMGDEEQSDDDEQSDEDDDQDDMLDDADEDEMRVDEEAYQIDQTLDLPNTQSMEQVKF